MVLVVSFVLLSLMVALYFAVVQAGSNLNSIKGAIISLAPSIVFSLIAWFIRKKITSRGKDNKITRMETVTEHGDHDERMEEGRACEHEIKICFRVKQRVVVLTWCKSFQSHERFTVVYRGGFRILCKGGPEFCARVSTRAKFGFLINYS